MLFILGIIFTYIQNVKSESLQLIDYCFNNNEGSNIYHKGFQCDKEIYQFEMKTGLYKAETHFFVGSPWNISCHFGTCQETEKKYNIYAFRDCIDYSHMLIYNSNRSYQSITIQQYPNSVSTYYIVLDPVKDVKDCTYRLSKGSIHSTHKNNTYCSAPSITNEHICNGRTPPNLLIIILLPSILLILLIFIIVFIIIFLFHRKKMIERRAQFSLSERQVRDSLTIELSNSVNYPFRRSPPTERRISQDDIKL